MPKVVYERPQLNSATPNGDDETRVDESDITAALIAVGLDPATVALKAPVKTKTDLADIVEAEVVKQVRADDLKPKEAEAFAAAFWTGGYGKNASRAISVWRIVTFMLRFPKAGYDDIPPELFDDTIFAGYSHPRRGVSSTVHYWCKAGHFARAQRNLNTLPLKRWSNHRRSQMESVVAWENQIRERVEAARKQRLLKRLQA